MRALKKLNMNYLCAMIYGVFGSLGWLCWFRSFGINMNRNPYAFPFVNIAGLSSMCICLVAWILNIYFLIRSKDKGYTIFVECLITITAFLCFLCIWLVAWELVSYIHLRNGA